MQRRVPHEVRLRSPQTSTSATSAFSPFAIGLACGVAAALFWASGLVAARHGIAIGLTPADMALHRFAWAGLVLLPIVVRSGLGDLGGVGWGRGAMLTLLVGPPFAMLSYAGFLFVPLAHGGLLQPSSAAVFGIVLATLVLKEFLPATRVIGAAVIIAGLMLIGGEAFATFGFSGIVGDLCFVGAGLAWAVFSTLLRQWRFPPIRAATIISVLSIAYAPVHWALFGFGTIIAAGFWENALQVVAQGVFSGPLGILLYSRAVSLIGSSRASVFPALVPALVPLVGYIALGEVPTFVQLGGLAIVGIGLRYALKA